MQWIFLLFAIVSEVLATTALKASEGFSRLWPSLIVVMGYATAFYFLSLTLKTIPVGIAYAVWSGVGVALVTLIAWLLYGQTLSLSALAGIAPEKAGIYIYRNESFGSAIKLTVEMDGRVIGETAAKTYLYKEVTPGKHTLVSHAENTDTLEVDVKPGTLAYVWQEIKLGLLSARSKLHLMSEEEGKKGVLETNLAQTK